MKMSIRFASLSVLAGLIGFSVACQSVDQNANTTATSSATPPGEQKLAQVPRPATIEQAMKDRGEQDQAKPTLRVLSPADNATINGSTNAVKLGVSGGLKGFPPDKKSATQKGHHIHLIL